jgi:hypothetical protein
VRQAEENEATSFHGRDTKHGKRRREGDVHLVSRRPPAGCVQAVEVPGREGEEALTVEATLRLLYHPAKVGDGGTVFPGFSEARLERAHRVE